jgi:biopolymer transport protein ExbD
MGGKFKRKNPKGSSIPTASTGDIAFLLLIFFMVTTIFRKETGLPVELPRAEAAEKVKQELVSNIFINRKGLISVDDRLIDVGSISAVMAQKLQSNPLLVVAFKADNETPYKVVSDTMEELKEVNALRVSFNAKPESNPGRKF